MIFIYEWYLYYINDSKKGWKIEVKKPSSNRINKRLIRFDPTDSQGTIVR